ncbi:LacI family DNA-binding transcriptional regulator [Actinomadura madurae]|uniref:LacI family DNA-binding transcriptional regulator n=1 Tax=Actinomadura madurae TaxID=1993 RepID=UPI0020264604|nr:LacI family DNA-binding transcriptional regulator [Actinomadura madurae]MCP9948839.1 LacI family transcriptional regulator [Actinomadura madurae]MCQ0010391.1 LacI family transcriptional regulator [Actinomadura madurae]URN05160.1 LacI family transcriptional regulator [Actinomadura madurae]
MAVTIRDVASASGVHVSTVSRTFSAPHMVNAETRTRVLGVAERLGYRPNRAARSLTTGRTGNLGLIVADLANPFFPPLIKAAQATARGQDYHLFVADTDEDPAEEQDLVMAFSKQVDGIVLCSPRLSNKALGELAETIPFVLVNRRMRGVPTVVMDVASGARAAMGHLAGLGHRRVALAAGPAGSWTSGELRRAVTGAPGLETLVIGPNAPTEEGGLAVAAQVAEAGVTGVLAYNDLVAIGLVAGLEERGVAVPGDVSVIGIDDSITGRMHRPKLTTVAMPTADAGRLAVDLLIKPMSAATVLETHLVVRESTAPPAGSP